MIALRLALLTVVASPLVLATQPVKAAPLRDLNAALQPCINAGKPTACPAVLRAIAQLQSSPAYALADPLCRQQIAQFKEVVALMAIRDTTPIEAQASFDGMAQTCGKAGL